MPTILDLLQAGTHFGHKSSRWHPKMEKYLFGERNGIHVIDLDKTLVKLNQALDYARDTAARGGVILFLGTKRQAKDIVEEQAVACDMPFVTERWLGGTLTNFSEVFKLVKRLNELMDKKKSGELSKYTKKEQSKLGKEIAELKTKVGGMRTVIRPPDAIFIVDIKKEKTALQEAIVKEIPVIALTDSNVNPDKVQYPIPSNDDAVKTIEMMSTLISQAIIEGKEQRKTNQAQAAAKAPRQDKPAAKPAPKQEQAKPAPVAEASA